VSCQSAYEPDCRNTSPLEARETCTLHGQGSAFIPHNTDGVPIAAVQGVQDERRQLRGVSTI